MYQTINLAKKFMEYNECRNRLNEISDELNKYLNSNKFDKKDNTNNLEILKNSFEKLQELRRKLLNLIDDLKEEIEKKVNKKETFTLIY